MTDIKGRVVNIEEAFSNLPHRIYLLMQYMNKRITTGEWGLFNRRVGIESLNHMMLLAYKVSLFFFYRSIFVCFLNDYLQLLSSQFLAALNQTYIATHSLVEKETAYETKYLKPIDELKMGEELRKKLAEEVKEEATKIK